MPSARTGRARPMTGPPVSGPGWPNRIARPAAAIASASARKAAAHQRDGLDVTAALAATCSPGWSSCLSASSARRLTAALFTSPVPPVPYHPLAKPSLVRHRSSISAGHLFLVREHPEVAGLFMAVAFAALRHGSGPWLETGLRLLPTGWGPVAVEAAARADWLV